MTVTELSAATFVTLQAGTLLKSVDGACLTLSAVTCSAPAAFVSAASLLAAAVVWTTAAGRVTTTLGGRSTPGRTMRCGGRSLGTKFACTRRTGRGRGLSGAASVTAVVRAIANVPRTAASAVRVLERV